MNALLSGETRVETPNPPPTSSQSSLKNSVLPVGNQSTGETVTNCPSPSDTAQNPSAGSIPGSSVAVVFSSVGSPVTAGSSRVETTGGVSRGISSSVEVNSGVSVARSSVEVGSLVKAGSSVDKVSISVSSIEVGASVAAGASVARDSAVRPGELPPQEARITLSNQKRAEMRINFLCIRCSPSSKLQRSSWLWNLLHVFYISPFKTHLTIAQQLYLFRSASPLNSNSLATVGFALPFVARATCPMSHCKMDSFPARYCSTSFGLS